ncbi:MAG: hypothetical protein A2270_02400 [Elusimicrobia bacterium RIFOXYA12_FULL_51_18]|nr:MAG: hypothetical protein A2270_02400 [Elusimicrobia bacterium RIFOXYA12_FULL_51_18]OGS31265.1 MAG: hypothetical protein A2218_07985 [Elusimicrobia bacterium RIFOXYA2_FULL_53_38]
MANELPDFTIFRLSKTPSLAEIIGSFNSFPELVSPVVPAQTAGLPLYTISDYHDQELSILPVFTSPELIEPPYTVKPVLPFLQMLFSSPAAEIFAFNPTHAKAKFPAAEIRLDKHRLSAAIGFLQTPSPLPAGEELEAALRNEAGLGNLHRANYMASVLLAGNPSAPPYGSYAETLINLGLLQEAYNYVKTFQTPDFFCYRAAILRLSGDPAKARQWLAKIPGGTPFEDKKKLELAWLALEESRTGEALDAFRSLAKNSFEKTGALFGVGVTLMKSAPPGRNQAETSEIMTVFSSALNLPSPLLPDIFIQLGNLNFRTGNYSEAAACYQKAADISPTIQSKANLGLAFIKTGNLQEAAALANDIALTDPASAGRLATELPADSAFKLLENSRQHRDSLPSAAEKPRPDLIPPGLAATEVQFANLNVLPKAPSPEIKRPDTAPKPESFVPPPVARNVQDSEPSAETATVSLEAALPRNVTGVRAARPAESALPQSVASDPVTPKPNEIVMESLMDAVCAAPRPMETETRKDDFLGRAFKLASSLEEELNKKVYFNADGLTEVEKKLRLTFMQGRQTPQDALEMVKDCAAFLCFLLKERHKGRLIKMPDFDHWGWPVLFETPKHMVTYPIQRAWRLLWEGESFPDPGWLTQYLLYVEDELRAKTTEKAQGAAAIRNKILSHPERRIDVQTEHRRIITLTTTLEETSHIELGRSGIVNLENALKENFRPDIPPTADGWKLLRCYGHILAEILIRDFKAVWYNVDGNDGFWSMYLPWRTFVFPIGKIYKAASNRESLSEYYDTLRAEKLKGHIY